MKDSDIDLSDMPELTDTELSQMVPSHFYRPKKQRITINIDMDILEKLKAQGKGYQTRINRILRKSLF